MIVQTLDFLINEISNLWAWGIGIVASWGITLTCLIVAVVLLWRRQDRLDTRLKHYHSMAVSEYRDASIRLNQLEK
jgi:hypothetical protein